MNKISEEKALKTIKGIKDNLELPEDTNVGLYVTRKKLPIPNYIMVFQSIGMLYLKELNPSALKILFLFFCKLQYSNHIGMNLKTISEEMKMPLITVKLGLKQLKDMSIIISYRDREDMRRNIYIINPYTAWKGTAKERIKTIRTLEKLYPRQLQLPFPEYNKYEH